MTAAGTGDSEPGAEAPSSAQRSAPDPGPLIPDPVRQAAAIADPHLPAGSGHPPTPAVRIGIGYDSHRFAPGGPMVLGGCRIPSDVSLVGHSDGDAIAHAVTDAILGGAGAGDIGAMFSDTDPRNRGRDSIEMLRLAVARVHAAGLVVHNVDIVVVAERPRIGSYRDAIRATIAGALAVEPAAVSVKGKSNEGMGWVGRGEGLACIAVASLAPANPPTRG